MKDPDLDDLRLVAALAAGRGARHAAQALGAHVATVYRRLQALEARLGQPLFERADGDFQPTPAGAELITAAADVLARLGALQRRLAADDGRLVGDLSVTTTDSLLPILSRALVPFQAAHPEVRLSLTVSNAMADMARRDADVAVRPTATPPETLMGRKVAAVDFAVYGSDVGAPERWVVLDDSLSAVPSARWAKARAEGAAVQVNSMWAAAEACAAGLGRAVLPGYLARLFPIAPLSPPIAELESAVWMLFHPDHKTTPRVRYFVREVSDALKALLAAPSPGP
ncbi:LysR family transcriptional regulator [Caulobacter sp. 1776]|uniref:LysR family transcriptional regulator n=1 Tax=Caulobacter sp. 1776 TaxID=3156420 RepID=UPI003395B41C